MKASLGKNIALGLVVLLLLVTGSALLAIVGAGPAESTGGAAAGAASVSQHQLRHGDEELAYLLVKLELKTRGVIAGHYARSQSSFPGINPLYKRWLTKNMILPAAVAGDIFAEVVPEATGGRAWVKMVVDQPRNPNNRPDDIGKELMLEIKAGAKTAERRTEEAVYYAEPIRTNALCLRCHGEPAGEPDPSFPEFKKDGWKADEVIGAVVARVARASAG